MKTEAVYVQGLDQDQPLSHRIKETNSSDPGHLMTKCGQSVSFVSTSAIMQLKHAKRFAAKCDGCRVSE